MVRERMTIRKGDVFVSPRGFAGNGSIGGPKGHSVRWFVWDARLGSRDLVLEMRPMMAASVDEHAFVTLARLLSVWTPLEPNPTGTPVWTEPEVVLA